MDKFSLNSYVSLMNTDGKWWVIGDEKLYEIINFLINMGMIFNLWIYQVVDLGLQIFMSNTVFEDTIGSVFKVAVNLYNALFGAVGITLFIFAIGSIFFVYAFKSPQESFRKLVTLFMVIGFNFAIYSKGQEYLTDVNGVFDEVETVISKAITLPMFNVDGSKTEIEAGTSDSVEIMRETYFKSVMQQSFAMINFGTSIYEERFNKFLYTVEQETDDNNEEIKNELKDLIKEESKTNRYVTPDGAGDKFFISIYSWVSNLFLGIPLLIMAMMKFLLKILILCMIFGLPIVSILSLVPKFGNSLMNALGKMMMVFFISLFMSVAMYLFFFIMALIDSSIIAMAGSASIVSCVLGAFVKAIVIVLIWKFRNQIVSFVTGGHVTNVNNMDRRMLREMRRSRRGGNDEASEVDSSGVPATIGHADIMIENANLDIVNTTENDTPDVDSRDFEDAEIEIENADIEVENDEDDETSETNENRDISKDDDFDVEESEYPENVEMDEVDRIEIEDAEDVGGEEIEAIPVEKIESIEINDVESPDFEDVEPKEVEDLDSLEVEVVESEKRETLETDSVEQQELNVNSNINNTVGVNDVGESPSTHSEEDRTLFYQELEDLRS